MDARVSGKGRKRLYLQEKQNNLRGKAQTGKAGRKDGTMLDKIDLAKKISKEEYKKLEEELVPRIQLAQRRCKSLGIPVPDHLRARKRRSGRSGGYDPRRGMRNRG